jgi:tetratricopeptide (TPR) repeat protein
MSVQQTGMTAAQAMSRAEQLRVAGQPAAAEKIYREILASSPRFHPAWHGLGLLALGAGKLPLAADLVARAVAIDGSKAMYQRNLGEMLRRIGKLDEAIAAGRQATLLDPNDLDAHYNLGLALTDKGDYAAAIRSYRCALEINPAHNLSWNNLGSALEKMGDKKGAEQAYAKAAAINPRHAEAQNNLGAIYSEQGKLDEASRCFETAIASRPDFVEAHYNLSSLKHYSDGDPHLAILEKLVQSSAALPVSAQIRYNFALGKAREDVGDYARAFTAYAEGNRLQHALLPCDEAQSDTMLRGIKAVFTREFFEARQPLPQDAGRTPVFIVGMPRSGTTLIEQILSSHPTLFGAGELMDMSEVIQHAPSAVAGQPFAEWAGKISAEEFHALGKSYMDRVWKLAPGADYITDKMPANFFHIGMIHLMLPNAKIIHAMRDPMDSCFSCYSRLFNDTMAFAYDLGTLGRYYVRYMQLMEHWRDVLPRGTVLDVRYEDMVEDVEGQSRRMLDYLGMPWNEACLAFYENKRHVQTASVAQVRKPIYKTSIARWERFGANLDPLLEIVRDYRDNCPR